MGKASFYGEVVVVADGQPMKSFACKDEAGKDCLADAVALAEGFAQSLKLDALRRGDPMPNVKIGRVTCDESLNPGHPNYNDIDYKFATKV